MREVGPVILSREAKDLKMRELNPKPQGTGR